MKKRKQWIEQIKMKKTTVELNKIINGYSFEFPLKIIIYKKFSNSI